MGGGLGWLLLPTGYLAADSWVAEAYPFLSAFTNPHFPIGMAIMIEILLLYCGQKPAGLPRDIIVFSLSLLLTILLPFGFVLIGIILSVDWMWVLIVKHERKFPTIIWWFAAGGLPVAIYQLWVVNNDPVLKIWNAQNLTNAPPIWDFLLSFSPALMVGFLSFWVKSKSISTDTYRILWIWILVSLVLVYSPVNLQRRFLVGFYIPCVLLAAAVLSDMKFFQTYGKNLGKIFFPLSTITNLLLLIIFVVGMVVNSNQLYLSPGQQKLLSWIINESPSNAIFLASPDLSLLIPARTGRRVVYGHPFETVDAESTKRNVELILETNVSEEEAQKNIKMFDVTYIIVNKNGDRLQTMRLWKGLEEINHFEEYTVIKVDQPD
jgi:hypothetical protein